MTNRREYLKSQLRKQEGFRSQPYKDTEGILTIGYGRNIQHKGISVQEAEVLLDNDVSEAISELEKVIPFIYELDSVRQYVLCNMMFNLGRPKFKGFKLMIEALNIRDFREASEQMVDSKWYTQVGKRAKTLVRQMRTGVL